jgi:mono/diheme cytochrome c family protein
LAATLFVGACQGHATTAPSPSASASALELPGYAFAKSSCAACHAVAPNSDSSPNPDAPSFATIANREGLTAKTLSVWLRDAHNYPNEMQFQLEPGKVDQLVTYMLTLKDPNYRPPS